MVLLLTPGPVAPPPLDDDVDPPQAGGLAEVMLERGPGGPGQFHRVPLPRGFGEGRRGRTPGPGGNRGPPAAPPRPIGEGPSPLRHLPGAGAGAPNRGPGRRLGVGG